MRVLDERGCCANVDASMRAVTSVLQVILGLMDRGEPTRQLMDRPRLHHQLIPNVVRTEPGYNQSIIDALVERGHVVSQIVGVLADGQVRFVVKSSLLHAPLSW
jgi:gamma-glutamyltranspeptidase